MRLKLTVHPCPCCAGGWVGYRERWSQHPEAEVRVQCAGKDMDTRLINNIKNNKDIVVALIVNIDCGCVPGSYPRLSRAGAYHEPGRWELRGGGGGAADGHPLHVRAGKVSSTVQYSTVQYSTV